MGTGTKPPGPGVTCGRSPNFSPSPVLGALQILPDLILVIHRKRMDLILT